MSDSTPTFALIGAAGFVAPRHLAAIKAVGGKLLAAVDPHDSVGVLDSYFPQARFFTEIERFDRYLEKLRRETNQEPAKYVSICSPNYLHDAHVRMALRIHAHAICEKPLVINPWNLDALQGLEDEFGCKVNTVLQLRYHPAVVELRDQIQSEENSQVHDVCLTYVTRRGAWYHSSWKGTEERSGGLAMNIGIHFFDFLMWVFGKAETIDVHVAEPNRMSGVLRLKSATVRWFLSVDQRDLPAGHVEAGKYAYRSITVDGNEIDLSSGFTDLHTRVYQGVLDGEGYGLDDARPGIELVHSIRHQKVSKPDEVVHPIVAS
ncbi:Gfo/Idh/MocA family oxidoreductase [Bremerella sp. T1]|uniref:Gfo/Idh/MocA family oxidoreductase n=1 Tax=Bremerella sp. TYQ1 TaxID=3119568 RepID=UPI001CCE74D4|nr:Gfo/Idh/MocA family oxidoreductase [Bremerella volcania]UBM36331.1 Gfo/Idh/MocA family oxidoreductase [Bremerella volcania]